MMRVCANCGCTFSGNKGKVYCCQGCKTAYKAKLAEKKELERQKELFEKKALRRQEELSEIVEVKKEYPIKTCEVCGKKFVDRIGSRLYCSRICEYEHDKAKNGSIVTPHKGMTRREINREAMKEGLTYGKYVLKHGL